MSTLPLTLQIEKENLRNLAGPELYLQTGLEVMVYQGLQQVNGGAEESGIITGVLSGISSMVGSGLSSAVGSALSGGGISFTATGPGSAASSAVSTGGASLIGSGIFSGLESFELSYSRTTGWPI